VYTEYECRAPETAQCRTLCRLCMDEQREQCECAWVENNDGTEGRTPQLESGQDCNIVTWLSEDAPDECWSGGHDQPVRGPGWSPIQTTWNGDNYEWEYADE
jgi:hypothetical protein